MKKKLISWLLSSAMAANILAVMPINIFAASGDSKIYEKEGYTVTYSVGSEWDNSQTIEVKIENTGEESILNWALKYDIDGTLSNVWNSKVFSSNEEYTIIKNSGYNYEIAPGQSVNYGYTLTSETEEPAEIPEDIEMYSRRIDVKSGYNVDFNVTSDWYTGFQAEIAITNTSTEPIEAWTLGFDSNFDINNIWNAKLLSSEEQSYVTANQLWTTPINPGASASFGFTADKSATENAWADNFTLTAVVVGESSLEKEPEIDYELDTDSDGLPDYYEEIIGSDPKTEHSDADQLPDGYEALYLGTDPSKSDSDDNGISDADEDFDTDGLTNLEEYNLGTDPFLEDSDYDTLSDKDEVNIHGTNPTKGDTDDDLVPDGDEVKLGLDPNSGSTNGTPDSERTFSQVVTAESEVLAAVNDDEETPFDVSLEITAAGVAESNVYARESGYSNAIENPSIIGIAPEFVYTDGLEVEEVTVKFELDDSIVDNTLGTYTTASGEFDGINRLNVFMFFEDINMLLPVETFRDETTNTVYTTTDRMGTYCLVDIEVWLSNLGISPEILETDETLSIEKLDLENSSVYNEYNLVKRKLSTANEEANVGLNITDEFDVVFLVDQVNFDDSQLEVIKDKIRETSNAIWERTPDASVVIYGYNGDGVSHFNKYGRVNSENSESLGTMLDNLVHIDGIDTVIISKAIEDLVTEYEIVNRRVYAFTFFDAVYDYTEISPNNSLEILNQIEDGTYDINISIALNVPIETKEDNEENECYATRLYTQTGGIQIDAIYFVEKALDHIYGERDNQHGAYNAIIATGYHTIVLDAPITIGYREAAEDVKANPQNLERYRNSGMVDTDDDELLDFQEINFEIYGKNGLLIQFDEDGYIKDLPLATVCSDLYFNTKGKEDKMPLTYVENGWETFKNSAYYDDLSEIHILPIISDPTHVDGDFDGINDINDVSPLTIKQIVNYAQILYKDIDVKFKYEQNFNMDFSWFFEDCTEYNSDMALASIIYAGLAYHTTYTTGPFPIEDKPVSDTVSKTDDEYYYALQYSDGDMQTLPEVMGLYGFEKDSIKTINLRNCRDANGNYYNDNHYIQFDIGKKDISQYNSQINGVSPQNVVGIFVRGTHGTPEWYSNFDIGNTDEWTEGIDWTTPENHMGFDIAATRAKKEIDKYLSDNGLNKNNTVIWLTGHSRGAAVSGIIATYLIADGYTVYAYNFATPNQVEVADSSEIEYIKCPGIFNIINTDDLVPYLPLENWNFIKYGEPIYYDSLSFNQRNVWRKKGIYAVNTWWHDLDGIFDEYDDSPHFLNETLIAFADICNKRNECYSSVEIDEYKLYVNDELKSLLKNVDPKFKYYSINSDTKGEYIYQKPIVFMQILAGVAASDIHFNSMSFATGEYTSEHFDKAALDMALFSLKSGMMNPHYVDGYIILCE